MAVSVAPAVGGSCTTGDTDVLINDTAANNGEVYSCSSSAWSDTGTSIQGPPGANGTDGTNGVNGTNGTSVTSTSLASGDPNCTYGGSSFTSASGTTYACNGAPGTAGAGGASTAGPGGLNVTIVQAVGGSGAAVAYCPSAEPYVISGGAEMAVPGQSDLVKSLPIDDGMAGDGQETASGGPYGWFAYSDEGGTVVVYAICSS